MATKFRMVPVERLTPAVLRASDILELFLDDPGPLAVPTIVERTGLPRTSVHELVATLVARGYLARTSDGRLRLGMRLFQLGSVYRDQLDLAREGHDVARGIAGRCDETVNVAVLDGTEVIYVATVDSTHSVRMVSPVGRRLPAHCTAVGKALLGELPDEVFQARYPREQQLQAVTPQTITSVPALRRELDVVRDRGLATEHREVNDAVACVAAPVRDDTGSVVAALGIAAPTLRWSPSREAELARLVAEGARTLSARLGYRDAEGRRPTAVTA